MEDLQDSAGSPQLIDRKKQIGLIYGEWKDSIPPGLLEGNTDTFTLLLTRAEHEGGTHLIDFIKYPVTGCQLHYIFPGQVSASNFIEGTNGYLLIITKSKFEPINSALRFGVAVYRTRPVVTLSNKKFDMLLYEFMDIKAELLKTGPSLLEIIGSRTRIILQKGSRALEEQMQIVTEHDAPQVVCEFVDLVEKNYKREKRIDFYAAELHVSKNYLSLLCRKFLEVSPARLIKNRVVLEAKRQLSIKDISIKGIVFDLGFSDMAHFSQFFKSEAGQSPSDFRKMVHSEAGF